MLMQTASQWEPDDTHTQVILALTPATGFLPHQQSYQMHDHDLVTAAAGGCRSWHGFGGP